jgi:hypothetical protein
MMTLARVAVHVEETTPNALLATVLAARMVNRVMKVAELLKGRVSSPFIGKDQWGPRDVCGNIPTESRRGAIGEAKEAEKACFSLHQWLDPDGHVLVGRGIVHMLDEELVWLVDILLRKRDWVPNELLNPTLTQACKVATDVMALNARVVARGCNRGTSTEVGHELELLWDRHVVMWEDRSFTNRVWSAAAVARAPPGNAIHKLRVRYEASKAGRKRALTSEFQCGVTSAALKRTAVDPAVAR